MRILLLGSTDLTIAVAECLRSIGFAPAAVAHVPDTFSISYRRSGVRNTRHADLDAWARQAGAESIVYQGPETLRSRAAQFDIGLAVGWYHMIPRAVRTAMRHGVLGIHSSLLPALRGGAPLSWAILSGMQETGVSLFQMEDGVDDGDVWGQVAFPVGARSSVADLVRAAEEGALRLVRTLLPQIAAGKARPQPQQGEPSWCLQRFPEDGAINWRDDAAQIDRLVRAVTRPYPGAYADLDGQRVYIWAAQPLATPARVLGSPGQLCRLPTSDYPLVLTGGGLLEIHSAESERGEDAMPLLLRSAHRRFGPPA
jgi:methionyl-tRNA formyltransferase